MIHWPSSIFSKWILLLLVVAAGFVNPLHLEVRQVHGSEGRSIAVDVKPEQLLVQMRICHLHECRTSIAFTKNLILSDLNPYCFYNLTAIDVHDPNNTVTEGFLTDLGTPKTKVSFMNAQVGIFSFDIFWEPINRSELHGPPSGYRLLLCGRSCQTINTTVNRLSKTSLRPRTSHTLTLWTYNINSFNEVLEDENVTTSFEFQTLADSVSPVIVLAFLSIGLIAVLVPFIIYIRRSRLRRRILRSRSVRSKSFEGAVALLQPQSSHAE